MVSRRSFIKCASIAGALGIAGIALPGCSESRSSQDTAATSAKPEAVSAAAPSTATANQIVIYFSHTGENYGVGVIDEGNTAIVAAMIAEQTGADLFEIVPEKPYPEGYQECCDVALAEQQRGDRPAYTGDVDLAAYDTVYLGYPIWWGDLPMCVYTFIEAHDWEGREVRPFCTHAGSGLAATVASLEAACSGAAVSDGLAISGETAQNSRDAAKADVEAWL